MTHSIKRLMAMSFALVAMTAAAAIAEDSVPLIDVTDHNVTKQCVPSNDGQATCEVSSDGGATGLVIKIAAGDAGYPGMAIKPTGEVWDLSKYGHIEAKITNIGEANVGVNMRVDNNGDWKKNPWNCESVGIKPGETKTVEVIFGFQYGKKPGYKLDPSKVSQVLFFTGKAKKDVVFRIESIVAAGPAGETPPVDPKNVRIKPVNGYVFGGGGVKFDAAKQLTANGASAEATGKGIEITFPGGKGEEVAIKPAIGRWDFTYTCDVRVKVKNIGSAAVTPMVQVSSDGRDRTQKFGTDKPLAPGATGEIVVHYDAAKSIVIPPDMNKLYGQAERGTGTNFHSDKVDAVRITADHTGEAKLLVESVMATNTPVATPAWLGSRPPVEGEWVKTLDDDFNGNDIDLKTWNVHGPNWWGAKNKTHWSKDNVIVGNGVAKIRFEKKTGWHNDAEESGHQSDYAGGYLDTYGKWTQKYGYFECRMKLPQAPGLWPAFWLMPDRGPDAGPQWKRQDTANGGMEFDIMEHLTRWGPNNFHVAIHWDGYQKNHKSTGGSVYVQPDKEGYITSGCLWLPGELVFYCNGKEIFRWESERVCSVPMDIMFTMPVGGWDNNGLDDGKLPVDWVIDYVRVWQRKDLATDADGYFANPSPWPIK